MIDNLLSRIIELRVAINDSQTAALDLQMHCVRSLMVNLFNWTCMETNESSTQIVSFRCTNILKPPPETFSGTSAVFIRSIELCIWISCVYSKLSKSRFEWTFEMQTLSSIEWKKKLHWLDRKSRHIFHHRKITTSVHHSLIFIDVYSQYFSVEKKTRTDQS